MEGHPTLLGPTPELQAHKGWRRYRHTIRPAGEGQPVVEDQADDFTEAQGHDRQVVTMHSQHGESQ
ncbi:hypothetical protein D3C76_1773940 [compost metagenome]